MTIKLRLFASITLGVVAAAVAHAQAGSYAYATASIDITGVYSVYGGSANVLTQVLFPQSQTSGPYAYGNAGGYSVTVFGNYGLSVDSSELSFANPNGHAYGGSDGSNGIRLVNLNHFDVNVDFTGVTNTSAYSFQSAYGDRSQTQGSAELWYQMNYGAFYAFQGGTAWATTDTLYHIGNYTHVFNFNESYDHYHYYGFESPYDLSATFDETFYWQFTLAPYDAVTIYETTFAGYRVSSERASTVPGPASVAPFAVGLLAALRRRAKKRCMG